MSRNKYATSDAAVAPGYNVQVVGVTAADAHPSDSTSFGIRVESRRTPEGVLWRAIFTGKDGKERTIAWEPRHLFLANYTGLHAEYVRTIMEGTGRPVIG